MTDEKSKTTAVDFSALSAAKKKFRNAKRGNNFTGQKDAVQDMKNIKKGKGKKNKNDKNKKKNDKTKKKNDKNKKNKKKNRKPDPFPDEVPVPEEAIQTYKPAEEVDSSDIKTIYMRSKFEQVEKQAMASQKKSARAEILNVEESGFIQPVGNKKTSEITQTQLKKMVDVSSAQKHFDLVFEKLGPYRMNYSRNGRKLLLGGKMGHVCAFDWHTKKPMCDFSVMQTVHDVQWLNTENYFAVAQKQWTYIYDQQGIETHCLKPLDRVLRLTFMPYHFLLVSSNAVGYLMYTDVSMGKKVAGIATHMGRLDVMCHNPANGVIHTGHTGGTVAMWTPNQKECVAKVFCHGAPVRSIAVDDTGCYMASSAGDNKLKIWDLRYMNNEMFMYKVGAPADNLAFSQRGLIAAGLGNKLNVYHDPRRHQIEDVYMHHQLPYGGAHDLQFCPFEDVLGVGHGQGFTNLLIPGASEANVDTLEVNPFQSKKQRQHEEVKMLLQKIQPEMITMDKKLNEIDRVTLEEVMAEKAKLAFIKPRTIDFEPKYKKKGKSKAGRLEKRKQGVKYERMMDDLREQQKRKGQVLPEKKQQEKAQPYTAMNRFKSKKND